MFHKVGVTPPLIIKLQSGDCRLTKAQEACLGAAVSVTKGEVGLHLDLCWEHLLTGVSPPPVLLAGRGVLKHPGTLLSQRAEVMAPELGPN